LVLVVFAGVLQGAFAFEEYAQICVVIQQQTHDLNVSFQGGIMKRSFSENVLSVHLTSVTQQEVNESCVSAACGHVQQSPCVLTGNRVNDCWFRIQES